MLIDDYRDMLSELADANAEYLLVGAFAMAAHLEPRATGDIDLWIRPESENARRVRSALARFGAPVEELTVEELTQTDFFFQIGVAPRRIDILTSVDGLTFEEAWAEREHLDLDGIPVPVLSRRHLIVNKKATGRLKDLADVEALERENK